MKQLKCIKCGVVLLVSDRVPTDLKYVCSFCSEVNKNAKPLYDRPRNNE